VLKTALYSKLLLHALLFKYLSYTSSRLLAENWSYRLQAVWESTFTKSADTRNAENVIIINDANVAEQYLQNWLKRKAKNELSRG
jgi:hypothetical protein